jgi:hypothetical protein
VEQISIFQVEQSLSNLKDYVSEKKTAFGKANSLGENGG